MKRVVFFVCAAVCCVFVSCIGIDARIDIAASGTVAMDMRYFVSNTAQSIGALGANTAYMILPVGKDDMYLAAKRAGGELKSWRCENGNDMYTVHASLRFPSPESLARFLDPEGERSVFTKEGGSSKLTMVLSEGYAAKDPDMRDFLAVAFDGYDVKLSVSTPKAPTVSGGFTVRGSTAEFAMKAADVYGEPRTLTVSW